MQRFLDLFISINYSACFRRFLRPSSGAQNFTYSVRYSQTNTAACCYRGWDVEYVQFCDPDDGRRNRLKHVEQFIEINRSRKVASCWLYFRDILAMHGHMNLIFMDSCILVWLSRITNKMQLVIEFIVPKFIEGSTCFERHTAHHQEL